MYRRMDTPGRIHLLGTTELYEYYVHVSMFMYSRMGMPGRIYLLGTTELYEYYVHVCILSTEGWVCQGGYTCSVHRNYIYILYMFVYRRMDLPGRIQRYYMNIMSMFMYRRMNMPGRIHLLGTKELYKYYVLVYVQADGYARADTSARYKGTI